MTTLDERMKALATLFDDREDFAGIGIARRGDGVDIVLRIDGTYFGAAGLEMAAEVAEAARRDLLKALKPSGRIEPLHIAKVIRYR